MDDFWVQLMPLVLWWIILGIPAFKIARREGISTGWTLFGLFPLWIVIAVLWWASMTDKDVLDRISKFEGQR